MCVYCTILCEVDGQSYTVIDESHRRCLVTRSVNNNSAAGKKNGRSVTDHKIQGRGGEYRLHNSTVD